LKIIYRPEPSGGDDEYEQSAIPLTITEFTEFDKNSPPQAKGVAKDSGDPIILNFLEHDWELCPNVEDPWLPEHASAVTQGNSALTQNLDHCRSSPPPPPHPHGGAHVPAFTCTAASMLKFSEYSHHGHCMFYLTRRGRVQSRVTYHVVQHCAAQSALQSTNPPS